MLSGAYRKISREEFLEMQSIGQGALLDWAEGCGYIAYDAQAQREFETALRAAALSTRKDQPNE